MVSGLRSKQGGAALPLCFFLLPGSGVMLIPHLGLSKQPHQILEEKTCQGSRKKVAVVKKGNSLWNMREAA